MKECKKNQLLQGYVALIYAMFLTFTLLSNFAGREAEHWRFFYAFTQQSNIIILFWLYGFGIDCFKPMPWHKIVRNQTLITAITVYISITFFIVAFVLDPIYTGSWNPVKSTGEFFHHNLTPVVMWLYFFIVQGEGTLKYRKALYILIYPLLYVGANLILGATVTYLDGKPAYAYGFINPGSYPNLLIFGLVILGLIAIFTLFGILLIKLKLFQQKQLAQS